MKSEPGLIDYLIHMHGIFSILGMILFIPGFELSFALMTVGSSTYYVALGWLWNPSLSILLTLFLVFWAVALPLLTLVFYILFVWKKHVVPYLLLVVLDGVVLISWAVYALCTGNAEGVGAMLVDLIATIGITVVMLIFYFKKSPVPKEDFPTPDTDKV